MAGLRAAGLVKLGWQAISATRSVLRPQIRFLRRPVVQCPFLVNDLSTDGVLRGLCRLHPVDKPLVCRLSPLTRTVETTKVGTQETWSVIPPVEGCPGMGRGPALALASPAELLESLNHEVVTMTSLVAAWMELQDETSAWAHYERLEITPPTARSMP